MSEENLDIHASKAQSTKNTHWRAWFGVALGAIAIILSLLLRFGSPLEAQQANDPTCNTPTSAGNTQIISAYDLWLTAGNEGTEQDFLASLVGVRGSDGYIGSDGITGPKGATGKSAYQLWLDAGNKGTPDAFLAALKGDPGADGVNGLSAYDLWILEGNAGSNQDFLKSLVGPAGQQGAAGQQGQTGATGPAGPSGATGKSAYEIWLANGNTGTESDFLNSLVGPAGATGATGATGPTGAPGICVYSTASPTLAFGDSGSFWDTTIQGQDGLISRSINTAYPIYLSDADTANNRGVSIQTCAGDAPKPTGYPVTPKSCITFSNPGVYNIAFSAQLNRTAGGSSDVVSFWLRENGADVPNSNTDVTLLANGQKVVAAWNFFAPVTCASTCSTYQIMWSYDAASTNLWYQGPQSNPTRPAIPSVILTVNQVK